MPDAAAPVTPAPVAPAVEPAKVEAAPVDPAKAEQQRRSDALARAKRAEAKHLQATQAAKTEQENWKRENAEALRKAHGLEELERLSKENPNEVLKAFGIDFGQLSKSYLEQTTGAMKTPAQLADEAVERRFNEKVKADSEAAAKREADAQKAQQQKLRETEAGLKKQLSDLAAADADRFELINSSPDTGYHVNKALKLVYDYWNKHQEVLDYGKALDAIEADEETRQSGLFAKSKKLKLILEKQRQAELEAAKQAKPNLSGTKTSREETRPAAATPSSTLAQSTRSPNPRPKPLNVRKMAEELIAQHKARSDN